MAYTTVQLVAAFTAVEGAPPDGANSAILETLAARGRSGELSQAVVLALVVSRADLTTAVVGEILRFFNNRPPRGMDVTEVAEAVAERAKTDPASQQNQLIAFAAELGLGQGRPAFAEAYGALDYPSFVAAAYETLIGAGEARAAGYDPAAAIADTAGRAAGFAGLLRDRKVLDADASAEDEALAVKAATVGYLICEAIKWNFGACARRATDQALSLVEG